MPNCFPTKLLTMVWKIPKGADNYCPALAASPVVPSPFSTVPGEIFCRSAPELRKCWHVALEIPPPSVHSRFMLLGESLVVLLRFLQTLLWMLSTTPARMIADSSVTQGADVEACSCLHASSPWLSTGVWHFSQHKQRETNSDMTELLKYHNDGTSAVATLILRYYSCARWSLPEIVSYSQRLEISCQWWLSAEPRAWCTGAHHS